MLFKAGLWHWIYKFMYCSDNPCARTISAAVDDINQGSHGNINLQYPNFCRLLPSTLLD